jgi:pimeloyl-ACP methyl ester carboxylesterase
MTPDQIFAVVAALLTSEANPDFDRLRDGGYDSSYPVTVKACDNAPGVLDVEGKTLICGTVSVPENYEAPDGRRVALEFVVFDALSQSPAPDPIVYLHGGPASGTLHMMEEVVTRLFPNHRRTRDIVTFDQRAAALSAGSVQCYESIADHIIDLVPVAKGEVPEPQIDDIVTPCIEEILSSGADLSAYNTENNARDVRALMSALGYPEYNIYGISYGTRLALEVLRTAPDGVRSAVIDGVAGPTQRIYDELLVPYADVLDALVAQCQADQACNSAYPDLKSTINAAFARLDETPIPAARGRMEINDDVLFELVFGMRNSWRNQQVITPYLPRIFAELAKGDSTTIDAFAARGAKDPAGFVPIAKGLSAEEAALVDAVIEIAKATQDLGEAASTALAQLRDDLAMEEADISVAQAFEDRSNRAVAAISDRTIIPALVRDYALLQRADPTAEVLADWVRTYFGGPDRDDLLALVAAMSPADLARTFEIADDEATKYQLILGSAFNVDIYACQEDIPWNSAEGFDAVEDRLAADYPILAGPGGRAFGTGFFSTCAKFEQHPREGWHTHVATDIPVLAINGLLDIQTSWKWGAEAIAQMTNARNIVVPEAGHGAIAYQSCANDISVAFLNAPSDEPDISCLSDIRIDFLMPDAPLPW